MDLYEPQLEWWSTTRAIHYAVILYGVSGVSSDFIYGEKYICQICTVLGARY